MKGIMKRAHELAKKMVGDYQARMVLALRQAWFEAKNPVVELDAEDKAEIIVKALKSEGFWAEAEEDCGEYIVSVSRKLSRGWQRMGYLVVTEDGNIEVGGLDRNKAGIRNLAERAVA